MNAIKVETTVDEATAMATPRRLSLEELLAQRVDASPGAPALTDADIERAIREGALDGVLCGG